MKELFKKFREIFVILAWLLIVAGLIYFVVIPLNNKIVNQKDLIVEEALDQQITRDHISELPKIEQQNKILQQDGDAIDVLLDKNDAVRLIERLEKVAEQSQVKITISVQDQTNQKMTAVTKSKPANDNTLLGDLPSSNYLQLKISLEGDYNSIIRFIDTIENFEYYCDIIDLDLKTQAQTEITGQQGDNGVLNPFASKNMVTGIKSAQGKISADLNVAFYSK